jgi:hypothetical protein
MCSAPPLRVPWLQTTPQYGCLYTGPRTVCHPHSLCPVRDTHTSTVRESRWVVWSWWRSCEVRSEAGSTPSKYGHALARTCASLVSALSHGTGELSHGHTVSNDLTQVMMRGA